MADASYIPVKKLTDTNGDYYPLSVTKSTYTPVSIQVRNNIGGYRDGDTIVAETSLHEILVKLFWDHSLAYLTTGDLDHDGSDFYYPENTWVESTKQEAINYVNSITGSNYIIGLKINNHVFEYVSKTEAIAKLNACSATDSIQHNRDYVSDNRVPSSRLVKKSILNLQNQVNDKQDSATAVTYDGINAVGSVTLPVYIDANGVPQTITSYEGNAATATSATSAASLTSNAGDTHTPVYFSGGVPVVITDLGESVVAAKATLSDEAKKMIGYDGDTKIDLNVGSANQAIYFKDGVPTAIDSTYGSSITPIYINAGQFTAISGPIGTNKKFIYVNNNGQLTATDQSVGSNVIPIYLDAGEFKKINGSIGENFKPIYVNANSELSAFSGNLGSENVPVYISNGKFESCSGAIGGAATKLVSASQPEGIVVGDDKTLIYFNNGVPVVSISSSGSAAQPVYLNNGKISVISGSMGSEGNPIYIAANGSVTPMSGDIGTESKPIYMKDGLLTPFDDDVLMNVGDGLEIDENDNTQVNLKYAQDNEVGGIILGNMKLDNTYKLNAPTVVVTNTASAVVNALCTGSPYINIVRNDGVEVLESHQIKGTDAIVTKTDGDGSLTIDIGDGLHYVDQYVESDFSTYSGEVATVADLDDLSVSPGTVYKVTAGNLLYNYTGSAWKAQNSMSYKWYRRWSDGWLEQGGRMKIDTSSIGSGTTVYSHVTGIVLDIPYATANYYVTSSQDYSKSSVSTDLKDYITVSINHNRTTTNVNFAIYTTGSELNYGGGSDDNNYFIIWKTEGRYTAV